jgi:hypothetical protein
VDATVGGLSRIVQPFRVSINAKGGDCWHVYSQSVLVIDGKNKNDDGMSIERTSTMLVGLQAECAIKLRRTSIGHRVGVSR